MKRAISGRAVAWGYGAQLLSLAGGVLLLPLLAMHAETETVGLWLVFITLVSLAQLLDLGLQPTLARAVAYAMAGSATLRSEGLGDKSERAWGEAHLPTLLALERAGKQIYRYAALATAGLLLLCGTPYIGWVLAQNPAIDRASVYVAWILFSAGTILNSYFGYYAAFIQGRGEVTHSNQIVVLSKTVFVLGGALLLVGGYGLVGLGLSALLAAVCGRVLARYFFLRTAPKTLTGTAVESSVTWHVLRRNALKLIIVQLGTFLIMRANVLIGAKFVTLTDIAAYGISVQVFMLLSGLATLTMNLQLPKLNRAQICGNKREVRRLLGAAVILGWTVYGIGALVFIICGNSLLAEVGKTGALLPLLPLTVLALIFFLETNHSIFASYLTTLNSIPFMAAAIISGAATALLCLLFGLASFGVWGLILAPGLVQIIYNNWKWPSESLRHIEVSLWRLLQIGAGAIFTRR